MSNFGELIPLGGGDPIPLLKNQLRVGRRESCDIVLRFSNISAHHCVLSVDEGYWFIRDLNSRNGVKVNDVKLLPETRKRLDPGDKISVAKHHYQINYVPADLGAIGAPPADDLPSSVMGQSLLHRAGLDRREIRGDSSGSRRYDATNNKPGQLKRPLDD